MVHVKIILVLFCSFFYRLHAWNYNVSLTKILQGECNLVAPRVCRQITNETEPDYTCGFIFRDICTGYYQHHRTKRSAESYMNHDDSELHITPLPRSMKFYDGNQDGLLTLKEFARTLGHNPRARHVRSAFRAVDRNGNGKIDRREFKNNVWIFDEGFKDQDYGLIRASIGNVPPDMRFDQDLYPRDDSDEQFDVTTAGYVDYGVYNDESGGESAALYRKMTTDYPIPTNPTITIVTEIPTTTEQYSSTTEAGASKESESEESSSSTSQKDKTKKEKKKKQPKKIKKKKIKKRVIRKMQRTPHVRKEQKMERRMRKKIDGRRRRMENLRLQNAVHLNRPVATKGPMLDIPRELRKEGIKKENVIDMAMIHGALKAMKNAREETMRSGGNVGGRERIIERIRGGGGNKIIGGGNTGVRERIIERIGSGGTGGSRIIRIDNGTDDEDDGDNRGSIIETIKPITVERKDGIRLGDKANDANLILRELKGNGVTRVRKIDGGAGNRGGNARRRGGNSREVGASGVAGGIAGGRGGNAGTGAGGRWVSGGKSGAGGAGGRWVNEADGKGGGGGGRWVNDAGGKGGSGGRWVSDGDGGSRGGGKWVSDDSAGGSGGGRWASDGSGGSGGGGRRWVSGGGSGGSGGGFSSSGGGSGGFSTGGGGSSGGGGFSSGGSGGSFSTGGGGGSGGLRSSSFTTSG